MAQMAKLVFKNGPLSGQTIDLKQGVTRIGRHPSNDISILDATISGFHCELIVSPVGVTFKDPGSRNGSFINGQRVQREIISAPTDIRLGAIELTVDVPEIKVAIPEREKPAEVFATFLDDGSVACKNHTTIAATQKCLKCENSWCEECVRRTGLVGSSRAMISCSECGGACVKIEVAAKPKPRSLLDRIGDTMMFFKK
jgi:hypothetical protein